MAKKQASSKPSLEETVAELRQRYGGRKLAPPLEGMAYRFTIWLPVLAKGATVFSERQRLVLHNLLNDCFGGFPQSNLQGFPPWLGSWLPHGAEEPIVDQHIHAVFNVALKGNTSLLEFRPENQTCILDDCPLFSSAKNAFSSPTVRCDLTSAGVRGAITLSSRSRSTLTHSTQTFKPRH